MSKKLIAGAGVVASFAVALAPLATFATQASNPSDVHTDQLVLTVLPSCTFGSAAKNTSPYPSGITHNNSQGDYGADGTTANEPYTHGATAWNNGDSTSTPTASDTSGALHDGSGNTEDHNTGDIASTGYGVEGEGMATSTNGLANSSEHTVHRSMLAGTTTDTFASTTMWVVCNNGEGYSVSATATSLSDGAAQDPKTIPVSATYSAAASGYNLKSITSTSEGTAMTIPTASAVAPSSETVIATHAGASDEDGDSLTVVYGVGVATSQEANTYAGTVTYKLYKGIGS